MSHKRDEMALELLAKANQEFAEYLKIAEVVRLVSDDEIPHVHYSSSAGVVINESTRTDALLG